jgi:hypothetical protein
MEGNDGQLTLMKDFCKKEQIFFNEGDRIQFLSTRSKNHYKLYRHAFDSSTTRYLTGGPKSGLKIQNSEQDFQKALTAI